MKHIRARTPVPTTQEELAEIAGMTPLAILRYEQYLYANPSELYIAALSMVSDISQHDLREEYLSQRHARICTAIAALSSINLNAMSEVPISPLVHPYRTFIYRVLEALGKEPSDMAWCTTTLFHPGQLDRFFRVGVSIPAVQRRMLSEAGMNGLSITALNSAVREYRNVN